ncbi:hypothetical protein [Chryseobacterium sp. Leaf394]|uniref:hypothetical protein n=1 Tax=Chryseobacterium sp. Leaf394 TaxID=1736361 RepID=UPI000701B659|nr:hypothetical protein [Chryseobacterium sp. Leaf394]KQS89191.1 hypothetical protein ASG21_15505 [Chryseobacterium sp. Leaf394]
MWTIIIILVAIFIIWVFISNNNDNEKIRNLNNNNGGLRKQFPNFTKFIEEDLNMIIKYDDGRNICYKKSEILGELNIGLKLEFDNTKVIYSKFIRNDGTTQIGKNVTYPFTNEMSLIEKCINTSIQDLNIIAEKQTSYDNVKDNVTDSQKEKYLKHWLEVICNTDKEDGLHYHALYLYKLDDINPIIMEANLIYKRRGNHPNNLESPSMNKISKVSFIYDDFFISAYPDVYLWSQNKKNSVRAFSLKKTNGVYLENTLSLMEFYRDLIDQYKEEGNSLECSK